MIVLSLFIPDSSYDKWVLALAMCKAKGANVVKCVAHHLSEIILLLPWKLMQAQLGGIIRWLWVALWVVCLVRCCSVYKRRAFVL